MDKKIAIALYLIRIESILGASKFREFGFRRRHNVFFH